MSVGWEAAEYCGDGVCTCGLRLITRGVVGAGVERWWVGAVAMEICLSMAAEAVPGRSRRVLKRVVLCLSSLHEVAV